MRVAGIPLGVGIIVPQQNNVVLDCPFNTANGLNELSGHDPLFTNYGNPSVSTTYDAAGALTLNGNQSLTTKSDSIYALGNKDFSIKCDVYVTAGSDFYSQFIGQRSSSLNAPFELFSLADGRLLAIVLFTDATAFVSEGVAIRDQWQTVEVNRVGDNLSPILDDVVVNTQNHAGKTVKPYDNFTFGMAGGGSGSGFVTGAMRNVKIKIG